MLIELRLSDGVPEASANLEFGTGDRADIVVSMIYEVLMYDDDEEEMGYEELITKVIAKMHRTLAYLGLCGRMFFDPSGLTYDDEVREEAKRVLDGLSEQDLTITPEDVVRVRREEAEASEKTAALFKKLETSAKEEGLRRGLGKEERSRMTLGEAFDLTREDR